MFCKSSSRSAGCNVGNWKWSSEIAMQIRVYKKKYLIDFLEFNSF